MFKKIGILGSGIVGRVLADGFLKHGYEVMMGTRDPSKLSEWLQFIGGKGKVGTFAEAASFADCVVLAVKGNAAVSALELAGAANLAGKIVIDTTNPIADGAPVNGVLPFYTSLDKSQMEDLQARFPDARFVKAFSCIGNAFMVNPSFPEGKPTMFICGNDDTAKQQVAQLLEQFGHEPADMGAVEAARAIEPLCMLWCIPGIIRNQWSHAFRLIRS